MPEPRRDDPLERVRHLEWENRVWKTLFFGLLSGLTGVLLLGGLGYSLHLHRQEKELEQRLEEAKRKVEETRRQIEQHQRQAEEEWHRLGQTLPKARQEPEPLKGRVP
jgi:uncharacterized membrane-anchored protein YhcB (DUF1043 family)